jgi:DNA-binding IclR family transcriptional regulator
MSEPTPRDELARTITGYWVSQAVYVAAKLRIADCLADGPRPIGEIAAATGTHPRALYRLLRALASVGIFSEEETGRFRLTPPATSAAAPARDLSLP